MRALLVAVVLSVATFHSALPASVEAEKEDKAIQQDGLVELLKVDQMEFEVSQMEEAARLNKPVQYEAAQKEDVIVVNVTVEDSEDTRYLEAVKDGCVEEQQGPADANTEGGRDTEAAVARDEAQSMSTEETEGEAVTESVSSSEEVAQDDFTKEQDGQE